MSTELHIGSVLSDRYELTRHLARGGMGDVYEGTDRVLHRPVAVKLYRAASPADRSRFDAEVLVLAGLNHPGLVKVYDAGSVGDDAYVVLELIDGPPLATILAEGPLPPDRVAALGGELAAALEHIHERGVVHRDVTPSNVLCDPSGAARLVDFGIARLLGSARVTAPQLTIGTAAYMAPEQVLGRDVDAAADVYALGLVLLEALTGRREYEGAAQDVAITRLARDPDVHTDVPVAWQALLGRMLLREPDAQPTATEIRARIAGLTAGPTDATAPIAVAVGLATAPMPVQQTDELPSPVLSLVGGADAPPRPRALGWGIGLAAAALLVGAVLLAQTPDGGDGEVTDDPTTTTELTPVTGSRSPAPTTTAPTTTTTAAPTDAPPGQAKKDKDKKAGPVDPVIPVPTTAPATTVTPPTTAPAA